MVAVLGLLAAALGWLRRRRGGGWSGAWGGGAFRRVRRLEAIEHLRLTPQHSLHLVRVEDRAWIVAVGGAGCTLLGSLAWPPGAAHPLVAAPALNEEPL